MNSPGTVPPANHPISDRQEVSKENAQITKTSQENISPEVISTELRDRIDSALSCAARNSGLGYWIWNNEDRGAVLVSPEYADIYGVSVEEIYQRFSTLDEVVSVIHPDDRANYRSVMYQQSFSIEFRLIRPDGETRYVREIAEPMLDADGRSKNTFGTLQDITDEKLAQFKLDESEEIIRVLSSNLPAVIYQRTNDKPYTLLYVNEAIETLCGYGSDEIMHGKVRITDIIDSGHINRLAIDPAILKNGQQFHIEYRMLHKDGSWRWVEEHGSGVIRDNKLIMLEGVILDITERKKAESEMLENTAFLRGSANIANLGYAVWSYNKNHYINVSRKFAALYGYNRQVFVDNFSTLEAAFELTHPQDRRQLRREYNRQLKSNDNARYQFRIIRPDGEVRHLHMWTQKLDDSNDSQRKSFVTLQDVTEQKQAEQALRDSEERFRDFAESASDWIWEMDENLRFIYISDRFYELLGSDKNSIIGKTRKELAIHRKQRIDSKKWQDHFETMEQHKLFRDFEYSLPTADGSKLQVSINGTPVFNKEGEFRGYRGTGSDVTESHKLNRQLSYQASHDALTGLVNRHEFEIRLNRARQSVKEDISEHALCFLDLDRFKAINDTCGHLAGDQLLRQVSELMKQSVRKNDTLARIGGDEFMVLMEHCTPEQASRTANDLIDIVNDFRFRWQKKTFRVGVSIGLVPINTQTAEFENLLGNADAACYTAKELGRNRVHVYTEEDDDIQQRRSEMQWTTRINTALDENRLRLYAQPIAPVTHQPQKQQSFEILLRMQDRRLGRISAGAFLPAAERFGLSTKLDEWVVNSTLNWLSNESSVGDHTAMCSINLSGISLSDNGFLSFIEDRITESPMLGEKICFEITETAAISNLDNAVNFINALKARGCRFALDDFGSGLSSFAYLKNLPVDFLKIDGAFVRDIVDDPIDRAMVTSINEIGHVMGKQTIAEFVENKAILEILADIRIDFAQGYYLGKPVPIESLFT